MEQVYEFRPLPDYFSNGFRRYANGLWIPDDGEYDLAFIGNAQEGYPLCLYVESRCRENITCSWANGQCKGAIPYSYLGSNWHYALRANTTDWGEIATGYWDHPNKLASDSGMRVKSSESGCCNGRSIRFQFNDNHIAAGLLRERDTKQVFEWNDVKCYYCGEEPTHTEYNKALKHAVARHAALKRIGVIHTTFDKCDCVGVVKEQILCGA